MILRFLCKATSCSCAGEHAGERTEPRGTLSLDTLPSKVKISALCLMRKSANCSDSSLLLPAERY